MRSFTNAAQPCEPTTNSWFSSLRKAPSSCLGSTHPQPFPRTPSHRHTRLQLRPRPLGSNRSRSPSPTQASVPVTLLAQPLQAAPTHALNVTPGATTFQLPPPAQPLQYPTRCHRLPSPPPPHSLGILTTNGFTPRGC